MVSVHQIHHLSQANPAGPGQGDVPALLRRFADTIEGLGPATVQDLVFATEITAEGPWTSLTAYFHLGAFEEEACRCGHCATRPVPPASDPAQR